MALVAQAIIVRELLTLFGGAEILLSIVLGMWLAWIAVGAAACPWIMRRIGEGRLFAILVIAAPLLLWGELFAARLGWGLLGLAPGETAPLAVLAAASAVVLAPFSTCVGMMFPCAARIAAGNVAHPQAPGREIAWLYVAEAAGTLLAGIVFTFLMAGVFSHSQMAAGVAAAWWAAGAAIINWLPSAGPRQRTVQAVAAALAVIALALLVTGLPARFDRATARRGGRIPAGHEVTISKDTSYQHVTLARQHDQKVVYAGGVPVVTVPALGPERAEAHLQATQCPAPGRVLFIGGPPASEAVDVFRAHGAQRIDVVLLDGAIYDMLGIWYAPLDVTVAGRPSGLGYWARDPRRAVVELSSAGVRYDAVIISEGGPSTLLSGRLYSAEFYNEIASLLAGDGILALTVSARASYTEREVLVYLGRIRATLATAFDEVLALPSGGQVRFFAAASPGALLSEAEALIARYRDRSPGDDLFPAQGLGNLMDSGRTAELEAALDGLGRLAPSTDLMPAAAVDWLLVPSPAWGALTRGVISAARSARLWHVVLLAALVAAARIAMVRLRPSAGSPEPVNVAAAVAASGAAGMASEVLLLFVYQIACGVVYERIGLVVGLFMLGLASGGAAVLARERLERPIRAVMAADVAWIAYLVTVALVAPGVVSWGPGAAEAAICVLVAAGGVVTGLSLTVAARALAAHCEASRAAAIVDAADHGGAFCGALLGGAVMLAAFGLAGSFAALATVKVASLAVLALGRRGQA